MTRCARGCVRRPRWSTGRSFGQGSMASQSPSTSLAQRSRVRRSSSWRCGSWRWQKQRSCRVGACEPARDRKAGDGGLSKALRPVRQPKDATHRLARDPHHGDLVRRGFQTRQGGVAPGTQRGAAATTSQRLDALGLAMPAIPNKTRGFERLSSRRTGTAGWDRRTPRC
jgi:hypothetical protein